MQAWVENSFRALRPGRGWRPPAGAQSQRDPTATPGPHGFILLSLMSRSISNCLWSTRSRNAFLSMYLQGAEQRWCEQHLWLGQGDTKVWAEGRGACLHRPALCIGHLQMLSTARKEASTKSTLLLVYAMQLNFNALCCKPLPRTARGCATN